MPDKFTAVWVSHTSISDFLSCPRAYFLKNVYKDPRTNHKIKLMSPPLALGQSVHDVLESLSVLPTKDRFREPLMQKFEHAWQKVSGKKGGFTSFEAEMKYKNRGLDMIRRVMNSPGPVADLAVKIQKDLPHYWLSEEDNIILCGKVDWLQYLPEQDSVHIIDFKTGKNAEDAESLQLPIYHLLVHNCQKRKVDKASYWYLDTSDTLVEKQLPDLDEARRQVLDIARKIKLARQLERFKCSEGENGCRNCKPFEAIVTGWGEFVGVDEYGADTYILEVKEEIDEKESVVL